MSPAGAYVDQPEAVGKANFGFVSKYKKGQSVPSGNTQFRFGTVGLDFKSTSYEWLVVTGSDCAKFKGHGTVNDTSGFGFMLTACDGDNSDVEDTFRIKIWNSEDSTVHDNLLSNSEDSTVYDNLLSVGAEDGSYEGTALSGGKIQIHQAGGNGNNRLLRSLRG